MPRSAFWVIFRDCANYLLSMLQVALIYPEIPPNTGKIPVIAAIEYVPKLVRLGNQFWVQDEETAVKALQQAGFKATYDALVS